jgi:hypothetical protein
MLDLQPGGASRRTRHAGQLAPPSPREASKMGRSDISLNTLSDLLIRNMREGGMEKRRER